MLLPEALCWRAERWQLICPSQHVSVLKLSWFRWWIWKLWKH